MLEFSAPLASTFWFL